MNTLEGDRYQKLIQKWEKLALRDLLDDKFDEDLQVSQAVHAFQEFSDQPLSEASYRAQIALLNASLIHQFEGACSSLGSKRFSGKFARFDHLIALSETLKKTPDLEEFQRFAKSCLYYRIGDYLLLSMKPSPEPFDKNQFVSALCAYAIALDHQCGGRKSHEIYWTAESFNILELKVLLAHNFAVADGADVIEEHLRSDTLSAHIVSKIFPSNYDVKEQFVVLDAAKHKNLVDMQKIDSKKLLTQIWQVRRHGTFLKRFLWIFAHSTLSDTDFLSDVGTRFDDFPQSLSFVYDVQDFSLFDLKLFIYRMSAYIQVLELQPKTDKKFLYPPHFQRAINKQFARIWKIVNTLLDNGDYNRDKTSERISFVSMLEEIRQCVLYKSDKLNLANTAGYLWENIEAKKNLSESNREMLMELLKRYTDAVLNSKCTSQESTLFQPNAELTKLEDENIKNEIHYLLAQKALTMSDYVQANHHIANISESGQSKKNVKMLIEKIKQRSLNVSPNSVGSFQMIEEDTLEPIEESILDDTFMTCNQSTKCLNNLLSVHNETNDTTLQLPSSTLDASKVQEQLESDTKQKLNRHLMAAILDSFVELSIQNTQALRQT